MIKEMDGRRRGKKEDRTTGEQCTHRLLPQAQPSPQTVAVTRPAAHLGYVTSASAELRYLAGGPGHCHQASCSTPAPGGDCKRSHCFLTTLPLPRDPPPDPKAAQPLSSTAGSATCGASTQSHRCPMPLVLRHRLRSAPVLTAQTPALADYLGTRVPPGRREEEHLTRRRQREKGIEPSKPSVTDSCGNPKVRDSWYPVPEELS